MHDVVLKMDIEGSEYEVVADIIRHQSRISCITGEFHDLDSRTEEFNRMMVALLEHFRVIHIHGNNCGAYDHTNNFPTIVEITFINAALLDGDAPHSARRYPRPDLDAPNEPTIPEYELRFE
ncbi:MAG: FkbM family methyltransferase [Armatimonadetes bacterium]|nr:FkbM family methyltransferase [Armatimonadota bacterium]